MKDVWFPSRLDGSGDFFHDSLVWEGSAGVHSEFTPENTISSEAASRDFEAVLALVDKHHIVLITRDEKPDIVAMGFHYYLERFGHLLPEEEYKKLKALDKPSSEPDNKDTDDGAP